MDASLARARTRRWFLQDCTVGLGALALGELLGAAGATLQGSRRDPLAQKAPHFPARARRVLYLHMAGAPSQLDLFTHKPKLNELDRQPCPESYLRGERFAFIKGTPLLLGTPHRFARHGEAGHEISNLLPHLAGISDELTFVHSMVTNQFNHAPAQVFLNTGHFRVGRPSMGAWLTYGLGTENRDLPGFVALLSGRFAPDGGASLWGSGFLPGVYQGVRFRSAGDAVLFLSDPHGIDRECRRASLDTLNELNAIQAEKVGDPEIDTRIAQYEQAYRMQSSVPELLRIDEEPQSVRDRYGVRPGEVSYANNCLLARRLLERGVRFVELYHWGWDSHGTSPGDDLITSLPERCMECDQPTAALILDLKQRGLLDDTLVIWGGEFGRTPMNEERNGSKFIGRDHHPHCFSIFLAGGGIRRGVALGRTDELGYFVTEDKVSVHDLHATMLHLLGFDHTRLTYRAEGRDYRLTDVEGEVVRGLLA